MNKILAAVSLGVLSVPLLTQAAVNSDMSKQQTVTPQYSIPQQIQQLQQHIDRLETQRSSAPDWTQRLHFHGFATFGLTRTDLHEKGVYYNPRANSHGEIFNGVNDSWNWRSLSRAGLQVTADLGSDTQLVTQFLARGSDDYNVHLQWAYISHDLSPNLTIRAGRLAVPFYMHSQYHDVGYAFPWVTLPGEVYRTIPGDTLDGIGVLWTLATGPVSSTFNLQWGNTDIYAPSAGVVSDFHIQDQVSANVISTWRSLSVRLGYSGSKVSFAPSPGSPLPAALFTIDKEYGYFANAGFKYDDGRFLLTGEWSQLDVNGWFMRKRSSYLTAGVHIGRWLPLVTAGRVDSSGRDEAIVLAGQTITDKQQRRLTYGVRYDVTSHVDLKASISHIYGMEGTKGLFNKAPKNLHGSHANILRLSVDAVF